LEQLTRINQKLQEESARLRK